jgi:hypothetical protein
MMTMRSSFIAAALAGLLFGVGCASTNGHRESVGGDSGQDLGAETSGQGSSSSGSRDYREQLSDPGPF